MASRRFVPAATVVRVAVIVLAPAETVGLAVATVRVIVRVAAIDQVRKAAVSGGMQATAAAVRKRPRPIVAAVRKRPRRSVAAVVAAAAMPSPAAEPDAAPWRRRHVVTPVSEDVAEAAACVWAAVAVAASAAVVAAADAVVVAAAGAAVADDARISRSSTTSA
jgi:hypothetical protein